MTIWCPAPRSEGLTASPRGRRSALPKQRPGGPQSPGPGGRGAAGSTSVKRGRAGLAVRPRLPGERTLSAVAPPWLREFCPSLNCAASRRLFAETRQWPGLPTDTPAPAPAAFVRTSAIPPQSKRSRAPGVAKKKKSGIATDLGRAAMGLTRQPASPGGLGEAPQPRSARTLAPTRGCPAWVPSAPPQSHLKAAQSTVRPPPGQDRAARTEELISPLRRNFPLPEMLQCFIVSNH